MLPWIWSAAACCVYPAETQAQLCEAHRSCSGRAEFSSVTPAPNSHRSGWEVERLFPKTAQQGCAFQGCPAVSARAGSCREAAGLCSPASAAGISNSSLRTDLGPQLCSSCASFGELNIKGRTGRSLCVFVGHCFKRNSSSLLSLVFSFHSSRSPHRTAPLESMGVQLNSVYALNQLPISRKAWATGKSLFLFFFPTSKHLLKTLMWHKFMIQEKVSVNETISIIF